MFTIFGNNGTNDTISWQPDPHNSWRVRFIVDMSHHDFAVVWTSIRLNIPEQDSGFKQVLRKFKWMVIGLLAPEYVLAVAWYQYILFRLSNLF